MRRRTLAREHALKILYQADITRRSLEESIADYWREEPSKDQEIISYASAISGGVRQNLKEIDDKISQYATNWQLSRMAIIDRNILRMSCFEFFYCPDIPPKVSINEAVELAKKYGDLESSKFVNGILDKIHKTEVIPLRQKL